MNKIESARKVIEELKVNKYLNTKEECILEDLLELAEFGCRSQDLCNGLMKYLLTGEPIAVRIEE